MSRQLQKSRRSLKLVRLSITIFQAEPRLLPFHQVFFRHSVAVLMAVAAFW
jgi:hypothetical protein